MLEADGSRGYGESAPSTASISLILIVRSSGLLRVTFQLIQESLTASN